MLFTNPLKNVYELHVLASTPHIVPSSSTSILTSFPSSTYLLSIKKTQYEISEKGGRIQGRYKGRRRQRNSSAYWSSAHETNSSKKTNQVETFPLNDSFASVLWIHFQDTQFKILPSEEKFSKYSGLCQIIGSSRTTTSKAHSLKLGDFIRFGSVGMIVCELNPTTSEDTLQSMSNQELLQSIYQYCPSYHPIPSLVISSIQKQMREKDIICYMCFDNTHHPETNPLISPCQCKGDTKYVHFDCLKKWEMNRNSLNRMTCYVNHPKGTTRCSICKKKYAPWYRTPKGQLLVLNGTKLKPPFVTLMLVTSHASPQSLEMYTSFQLSVSSMTYKYKYLNIGRSMTNDLALNHHTVSSLHAQIYFQKGAFLLRDRNSSNGTLRYLSQPLSCNVGETIHLRFGKSILRMKTKKRRKWKYKKEKEEERN